MITEKEWNAVELSPTHKDFYQIWNELLDTASKLSERWDPSSTNESDPGIVLLKVLTAIADKLNYNIDKNTLEAFMPSAAQEESMRKLCEMMGYNIKYYQSATTNVTISCIKDTTEWKNITIPKFTYIKNKNEDLTYFTLEEKILTNTDVGKVAEIKCMEGELVDCESDYDNIISLSMLDDNNRYFLPETQIAENGIFIWSINDNVATEWKKVENLNTQPNSSKVWKFGYSSTEMRPYIQFPDDVSTLIEDGFVIKYTRTNGINGNTSVNTLVTLALPEDWSNSDEEVLSGLTADDFSLTNNSATMNGRNIESINEAYNSYKKTVGTFDTLVTCRDYINKIYQMTTDDANMTPLVSNVIVSDIRDDLNRSITLCSFNDYGICYTPQPLKVSNSSNNGNDSGEKISHFDLVLYPFKTINGLNTKDEFINSFKYSSENLNEIKNNLEENKTLSHNIVDPEDNEIVCIKNYLRLNARITTTRKVNAVEETIILTAIYKSIYENFNMRKVDFGEEIMYDSILECIEKAHSMIKNVSLDEPILYTAFCTKSGNEYTTLTAGNEYKINFNKMARRNVLAGRVPMFEYDEEFKTSYAESKLSTYAPKYPTDDKVLKNIETDFHVESGQSVVKLYDNEVIQFRAPEFKTTVTYPAYVNYYIKLKDSPETQDAQAAKFITLESFMNSNSQWNDFLAKVNANTTKLQDCKITKKTEWDEAIEKYKKLFKLETGSKTIYKFAAEPSTYPEGGITFKKFPIEDSTWGIWYSFIKEQKVFKNNETERYDNIYYSGIFRSLGADTSRQKGYLVDDSYIKYVNATTYQIKTTPFVNYFVQCDIAENNVTKNNYGLGKDAVNVGINKDSEYELKESEYLLINYTDSETEAIKNIAYGPGTIIRPNFNLIDSDKVHTSGTSWSKTKDFSFQGVNYQTISDLPDRTGSVQSDPPGMFGLGTDQQIEIRDVVKTVLIGETDSTRSVLIYWKLNNEKELYTKNDIVAFPTDSNGKYTLQAGEYFYYTDINKINFDYFGSGTEIKIIGLTLTKSTDESEPSYEDIATYGLAASIPWRSYTLDTNKSITIQSHQYINLTSGDTLVSLTNNTTESSTIDITLGRNSDDYKLNWLPCKNASYVINDLEEKLPRLSFSIRSYITWEIRSILSLNVGPAKMQTINSRLSNDTELNPKVYNCIKLNYTDGSVSDILGYKDNKADKLSIKSLYEYTTSAGEITTYYTYKDSEEKIIEVNDTKISVFKYNNIELNTTQTSYLNIGNYGENGNWTKISFKDEKAVAPEEQLPPFVKLNITIPTGETGLIMFYYTNTANDTKAKNACIKLTGTNKTPKIYNAENDTTLCDQTTNWWKNKVSESKYELRNETEIDEIKKVDGINVVEIAESCTLEIYSNNNKNGTLVFSNLKLVKEINPRLQYFALTSTEEKLAKLEKLKVDIANDDKYHDFYYNTEISNSIAIDLNTNIVDETASTYETLATPYVWYDYNNINNKFVISEIDANYMKNGIVIARTSKQ